MDKKFLVITQTAKRKEIAPWWEHKSFSATKRLNGSVRSDTMHSAGIRPAMWIKK